MTTTTTQVQQYCCQIALITLTFCYLEFSSALLPAFLLLSLFLLLLLLQRRTSEHEGGTRVGTTTTTTTHRTFRCKFFLLLSRLCAWVTFPGVQVSRLTHTRDSVTYIGPHSHTQTHRPTLCVYFFVQAQEQQQQTKIPLLSLRIFLFYLLCKWQCESSFEYALHFHPYYKTIGN